MLYVFVGNTIMVDSRCRVPFLGHFGLATLFCDFP